MYTTISETKLANALQMYYTTYIKTECGLRDLSFLMALRLCQFDKMDLHEVSMLSDEELGRGNCQLSMLKKK